MNYLRWFLLRFLARTRPLFFVRQSQWVLPPFIRRVMSSSTAMEDLPLDRNIADTSDIGKLTMSVQKSCCFGMTVRFHFRRSRNPPELNAHPPLLPHFHLPEKTLPKVPVPDWFPSTCNPAVLYPIVYLSRDTVHYIFRVCRNDQTTKAIHSPVSISQSCNDGANLRAVVCQRVLLASGPFVLERKACVTRCRLVVDKGTTRSGVRSAVVHTRAVC